MPSSWVSMTLECQCLYITCIQLMAIYPRNIHSSESCLVNPLWYNTRHCEGLRHSSDKLLVKVTLRRFFVLLALNVSLGWTLNPQTPSGPVVFTGPHLNVRHNLAVPASEVLCWYFTAEWCFILFIFCRCGAPTRAYCSGVKCILQRTDLAFFENVTGPGEK